MNNPLSLFTFPYRKRYYLMHPIRWFNDLLSNIKNFIHRGRYGFSYVDVWNFCDWFPNVGAQALRYLAEHANGYPANEFNSFEEWTKYLNKLADKLQHCVDAQDILHYSYDQECIDTFTEVGKILPHLWD